MRGLGQRLRDGKPELLEIEQLLSVVDPSGQPIHQIAGSCRFVFNKALALQNKDGMGVITKTAKILEDGIKPEWAVFRGRLNQTPAKRGVFLYYTHKTLAMLFYGCIIEHSGNEQRGLEREEGKNCCN